VAIDCCGAITGDVEGSHLSFSFPISNFGLSYTTDVYVSDDGSRLGGYFTSQSTTDTSDPKYVFKVAWLRHDPNRLWLPLNVDLADEELPPRVTFRLSANAREGAGFLATESYELAFNIDDAVYGDFGSFWSTEIRVRPDDGSLVLGPVPETHPDLPVQVVLERAGKAITNAAVSMPDGNVYPFDATRNE
jgi:hypothetical protein